MAYTKTNWVDNTTPISAANLNNLETQYDEAMADMATIGNAAQLGGIPAADYIRGDAGAPNPQAIQNPVMFENNITLAQDIFWDNATANQSQLAASSRTPISGVTPNLLAIALANVAWLFGIDQNGNVGAAGSINAASGDITGALAVGGNLTTGGTINGTAPTQINANITATIPASTEQYLTMTGLPAGANSWALALNTSLTLSPVSAIGEVSATNANYISAQTNAIKITYVNVSAGTLTVQVQNGTTNSIGVSLYVGGIIA